jgi:hypothetical protein
VVNMGTPARPRVPWLRYGGIWGKPKENKIEGEGPEVMNESRQRESESEEIESKRMRAKRKVRRR